MSEQVLLQILDKLTRMDDRIGRIEMRIDMIESRIDKIENRIDMIESRIDKIEGRIDKIEIRISSVETEVKAIKADTSDIPLIRRAVLETADLVKGMDGAQRSFEKKMSGEVVVHDHSIDILNRRQLKLESELERLKK
ncbi:hypothetical protein RB620_04570 [Paenibacillus sp. LHD-117]|uniref:hypothetical protein n=1 Tax=Paenibacillus sp. LHD-117 TaxID=3071412 RepID=UPI0027DFEBF7|nr:hypothetical protein [Paenibacillus sp. LHD-117]MDQ6418707.1 hypothetical protein [Paenibacillus sp. LHD-117]